MRPLGPMLLQTIKLRKKIGLLLVMPTYAGLLLFAIGIAKEVANSSIQRHRAREHLSM